MRRVLLVDPIFHVHSLVQYEAALHSTGWEDAEFTFLTGGVTARDRSRLSAFFQREIRAQLVELPPPGRELITRWDCWRAYAPAVNAAERLLANCAFDRFAYLMLDNALPCFARPGVQGRYPAHSAAGLRGLLFRDNGLRPAAATLKGQARSWMDRAILHRVARSGIARRLLFYDHHCAELAARKYGPIFGEGIDPVEVHASPDRKTARQRLGWPPDAWVALLFGVMSGRKAPVETLRALVTARREWPSLVVAVAGPVDPGLRHSLEKAVAQARCRFPVLWRDEFIPEDEMADYFAAADGVICAYERFNASSGVLLHAASFGKPALVSPGGVMADAVQKFGFGQIARLADPAAFGGALHRLMNLSDYEKSSFSAGARAYAATMDARRFMSQFEDAVPANL